jgi:hypothetical protein
VQYWKEIFYYPHCCCLYFECECDSHTHICLKFSFFSTVLVLAFHRIIKHHKLRFFFEIFFVILPWERESAGKERKFSFSCINIFRFTHKPTLNAEEGAVNLLRDIESVWTSLCLFRFQFFFLLFVPSTRNSGA